MWPACWTSEPNVRIVSATVQLAFTASSAFDVHGELSCLPGLKPRLLEVVFTSGAGSNLPVEIRRATEAGVPVAGRSIALLEEDEESAPQSSGVFVTPTNITQGLPQTANWAQRPIADAQSIRRTTVVALGGSAVLSFPRGIAFTSTRPLLFLSASSSTAIFASLVVSL